MLNRSTLNHAFIKCTLTYSDIIFVKGSKTSDTKLSWSEEYSHIFSTYMKHRYVETCFCNTRGTLWRFRLIAFHYLCSIISYVEVHIHCNVYPLVGRQTRLRKICNTYVSVQNQWVGAEGGCALLHRAQSWRLSKNEQNTWFRQLAQTKALT